MTINELMSLMKVIRSRVSELEALSSKVATRESWRGEDSKVIEPQYDIKLVDKKLVGLQNFLFKADAAIKQANAKTEVSLEVNVDELLAPLQ
jgi:hypothetical protein